MASPTRPRAARTGRRQRSTPGSARAPPGRVAVANVAATLHVGRPMTASVVSTREATAHSISSPLCARSLMRVAMSCWDSRQRFSPAAIWRSRSRDCDEEVAGLPFSRLNSLSVPEGGRGCPSPASGSSTLRASSWCSAVPASLRSSHPPRGVPVVETPRRAGSRAMPGAARAHRMAPTAPMPLSRLAGATVGPGCGGGPAIG